MSFDTWKGCDRQVPNRKKSRAQTDWGRIITRGARFAAIGAVAMAPLAAASAQQIGVTTAVTLETTGEPPGGALRQLEIGTNLVANERVETSETGPAHLIFHDRSALIVAPNSSLVLDEYVYDPKTGTGRAAFSATKGFFRFVGGTLSKRSTVEFRTPLATVGLRGGIADLEVTPERVVATKLFGVDVTITPTGAARQARRARIRRNGYKATVTKGGGVAIAKVSPGEMAKSLGKLGGEPGLPPVLAPAAGAAAAAAIVPTGTTQVVDAGALRNPANVAPAGLDPASTLSRAGEAIFGDVWDFTFENAINENPIEIGRRTFAGFFGRDPLQDLTDITPGVPTAFANFSSAPIIDGNFFKFVDGTIDGGFLSVVLDGGGDLVLPASGTPVPVEEVLAGIFTGFSFGSEGTQSPFGPVFGEGFSPRTATSSSIFSTRWAPLPLIHRRI